MKPETADYLAKARKDLGEARQIIQIGLANVAARSTYYAAFHAAEELIFERTGRVAKTHKGVQSEFARLTKDDPRVSKTVMAFAVGRRKDIRVDGDPAHRPSSA